MNDRPIPPRPGAALLGRIGGTPLVPLGGLEGVPPAVEVFGKAEWFNPGGSVKDRPAWAIVRDAIARGRLAGGRRLLDATSGNTGIAYAWIGAALGFGVTLCVPGNLRPGRRRRLERLGAELVLTDPLGGTDAARVEARRLARAAPARYALVDQYDNPANWRAHYHGTGEEIWAQTAGRVTHLVAGVGTAGTLVGAARRLRKLSPALVAVAVQPDSPYHALEGLKHLATESVPGIYDPAAHQRTEVVTSEAAAAMARQLTRRGLPAGASAGASAVAAARVARELDAGVVVAVLPDAGAGRPDVEEGEG